MRTTDIQQQIPVVEDDPVLELLENAPWDDEPVTEEDLRSLEEGREDYLAGCTISSEEIKRAFRERQARKQ